MKTNNLSKKSFLTTMILAMSSVFSSAKHVPVAHAPNGYVGGGSPVYISGPRKFKGFDRENMRYNSFNKKKK